MSNFLKDSTKAKIRKLTDSVTRGKGKVTLFGFFLRDDSPGLWDIVVSAPWLDKSQSKGIRYIAKKVDAIFSVDEKLNISRVVALAETDPFVSQLTSVLSIPSGGAEFDNCNFNGVVINRALITAAIKPTVKIDATSSKKKPKRRKRSRQKAKI